MITTLNDEISELLDNTLPVIISVPPTSMSSFLAGRQVYADGEIDRNGPLREVSSNDPLPHHRSERVATSNVAAGTSKITINPQTRPEIHLYSSSRRAALAVEKKAVEKTPESSPDVGTSRRRKRAILEDEDDVEEQQRFTPLYRSDSDPVEIPPPAKRATRGTTRGRGNGRRSERKTAASIRDPKGKAKAKVVKSKSVISDSGSATETTPPKDLVRPARPTPRARAPLRRQEASAKVPDDIVMEQDNPKAPPSIAPPSTLLTPEPPVVPQPTPMLKDAAGPLSHAPPSIAPPSTEPPVVPQPMSMLAQDAA